MQFALRHLSPTILLVLTQNLSIGHLRPFWGASINNMGGAAPPAPSGVIVSLALGLDYVRGADAQFIYGHF